MLSAWQCTGTELRSYVQTAQNYLVLTKSSLISVGDTTTAIFAPKKLQFFHVWVLQIVCSCVWLNIGMHTDKKNASVYYTTDLLQTRDCRLFT